jgi:hypothetical protein
LVVVAEVAGKSRGASVLSLTEDSQIGANLRIFADEEDRANFDQRG